MYRPPPSSLCRKQGGEEGGGIAAHAALWRVSRYRGGGYRSYSIANRSCPRDMSFSFSYPLFSSPAESLFLQSLASDTSVTPCNPQSETWLLVHKQVFKRVRYLLPLTARLTERETIHITNYWWVEMFQVGDCDIKGEVLNCRTVTRLHPIVQQPEHLLSRLLDLASSAPPIWNQDHHHSLSLEGPRFPRTQADLQQLLCSPSQVAAAFAEARGRGDWVFWGFHGLPLLRGAAFSAVQRHNTVLI